MTGSKPPSLFHNPLSLFGLLITVLSTGFGLPMMFLDILRPHSQPYLAAIIYLVLPFAAMGGVGIMLLGALVERRRRQRPGAAPMPLPKLDLNQPAHQAAVLGAMAGVVVLVVLLSITGYRAYHFTESTKFCGTVCHQVMQPEFTAYQHSPHARVACTQCHVGPGANWYVRSKLSGLYQVYSVMAKKYPRPIGTPVHNLRPAQETCEQCHWPAKFFGAQQKTFSHYLTDEQNSPWKIEMLLKIGGGDPKVGAATGIHWHMNIKNTIDYIADEERENIPWVRATDLDGNVTEYMSTDNPLTPAQIASSEVRRMDCVDCHNRPSHVFHPPDYAIEQAINAGRIDRSLPYVKREGLRLLIGEYASDTEAREAILTGLAAFYQKSYPELARDKGVAIRQATDELLAIYGRNFFPYMKADWRVYPNHIGHVNTKGCFRCHDGLHKSGDGKVITRDCNACHTILAQGPPEALAGARLEAQPFQHPVDMGGDVTEMNCNECHTGTGGL